MKRKILAALLALCLIVSLAACSDDGGATTAFNGTPTNPTSDPDSASDPTAASDYDLSGQTMDKVSVDDSQFNDSDTRDKTAEVADAVITLSGSKGTISDTTRGSSGSEVTITAKGTYRVTGTSDGVSIVVNDPLKSGNIYLILDNASMTNAGTACLYVASADKVIVQYVGENTLESTSTTSEQDGAIYAKDDITLNGTGTLRVTGAQNGIVCKDDLKITGGSLIINAATHGIKANDSLRIGGGSVTVTAKHDGVHSENSSGDSYVYMSAGTLTINAGTDGIQVSNGGSAAFTGYIKLVEGTVDITAGGGSSESKNGKTSQKGLRCDGDIYVGDVKLSISSADDAIHSSGSVSLTAGTVTLSSSDDGIHADSALLIAGGEVSITKSYEGIEAYTVTVSGGTVSVTASDDGINAAGGSDTSSKEQRGPWGSAAASGSITVSGGSLYVNAQGDGLDSNGSLYITGGTVIVEGPSGSGNGALDKGDGSGCVASVTGGVVLAIGSTDMAVNFDAGTQCSALVNLSGSAGTVITVNDGSGFSFTASKSFACAVYSSPNMTQGGSYTITAGSASAVMDFSASLYYSDVKKR